MSAWHPNQGRKPARCTHVYVRLRNGIQPADKWPVDTGKAQTTRWSLTGCGFDIVEWRAA